ncbi:MAG: hypothetical protein ABFS03_01490 [Chloroflexota bacterium]
MAVDVNIRKNLQRFAALMGWNRASYTLISAFILIIFLIIYIWWPLAEEYLALIDWHGPWWLMIDWLLFGIFGFMSLLIMAGADLRVDALIIFVGFVGGLVIESWGTQTEIWSYYTAERPPLWIIPAWPIASLAIDRMVRFLRRWFMRSKKQDLTPNRNMIRGKVLLPSWVFTVIYWLIFPFFYALMVSFVWATIDKSLTVMALVLVAFMIFTPTNHRLAVLTFLAGSGLGYFLELWGTTRLCWTYYTQETPPIFAVFAHGMAAVAFWRTALVVDLLGRSLFGLKLIKPKSPLQ